MRKLFGFALLASFALGGLLLISSSAATGAAGPQVISVLGVAHVGGQKTFVEVILTVPPGKDANALADEALAAQGARRPQAADFTTEGFTWPQFGPGGSGSVQQNYNAANQPTSAQAVLASSEKNWTDVVTSRFAFAALGTTGRCPSLVRECPGAQVYDGNNDVGWVAIGGCCTLGVTWYGTGPFGPEADMALNTSFPWATNGSDYDIETVFLHENGHVVGLGHSADPSAVMYPSYHGVLHSLQCDDRAGVTALYPESGASVTCGSNPSPTPTPTATSTPVSGATPTATSTRCPPGRQKQGRC